MMHLHTVLLPLFFLGCTKEPTSCEQLQEEVCECEGEAAEYYCEVRTEQADEAKALLEAEETALYDDAEEICAEVYDAFMKAGGCGSLIMPEEEAEESEDDTGA